jgi:hypothetical protein
LAALGRRAAAVSAVSSNGGAISTVSIEITGELGILALSGATGCEEDENRIILELLKAQTRLLLRAEARWQAGFLGWPPS